MKVEILGWHDGSSDDRNFLGYVDVAVKGVGRFFGLKVFRAGHTKWGISCKPPYLRLSGKNLPAYSLEGEVYSLVLSAIKKDISHI